MDDQRFDRISRAIASSTSRRSALKGIAAALGGGALVSLFGVRAERAAAQGTVLPGGACTTDEECSTGLCSDGGFCYCEDPSRPLLGCGCTTGTENPCGESTLLCCATDDSPPGGPGICTSDSVGCDPTGGECFADPGGECISDDDCCTGTCMGGICACEDPSRPWIGCGCSTGTEAPCGGGTALCCATDDSGPGGPGICTSGSVGCNPTGECTSDPGGACASDADCCEGTCSEQGVCYCSDPARPWIGCSCNTGTEAPCGGGTVLCCPLNDDLGSIGVCTSGSVGCQPLGECGSYAGEGCGSDADCCEGSCGEDGICYCLDPAEPLRGCACHTGTENPCGDDTLLCCAVDDKLGGDGICTPDRLGCDVTGECGEIGGACTYHDDCCGYLYCGEDGICAKPHHPHPDKPKPSGGTTTVTTLPSTGTGPQSGAPDATPWVGAAVLAGAAALAASKLRQQAVTEPARQD